MKYLSSKKSIDYMPRKNIYIIYGYPVIVFRSKGSYFCIVLIKLRKIKKKRLASFCFKGRASFWEADYILSSNITGSLACKMNHIAEISYKQQKPKSIKKGKLDKLIPNLQSIWYWRFKKAKQKNGHISVFHTFKNILPKYYAYKNTLIPEISSKGARKASLVKHKNKMLLQTKLLLTNKLP